MANIPISALPSVQPSGYTNDDLLVIVNYDFTSGTTKNTPLSGLTSYILSGLTFPTDYLPLSGGTVTGDTIFSSGLTATTISASTYLGLPLDVYVTGGTYSAGTITFTNNSGGTFPVSGLTFTGNTSASCITDLYVDNLYGCSPINVQDSLIMTTGTSISTSNGGTQINLDPYGTPNSFLISDDNASFNSRGFYFDNNGIQLFDYKSNSLMDIYSQGNLSIGSQSNKREIFISTTQGSSNNTGTGPKKGVIISSENSYINTGVTNSVILGGTNIVASNSNTVYVSNLNIRTVGGGSPLYNLGIDSNGFVVSGITSNEGNQWLIPAGDTVTVESNYQYFIYGDLIVQGTLILDTDSQLVVVNGDVINSGGTITNNGTISNIEIPLFDTKVTGGTYSAGTITFTNNSGGTFTVTGITSTFTGNTSATCITDLYVNNVYGCSPITIHDDTIILSGLTADTVNNLHLRGNKTSSVKNIFIGENIAPNITTNPGLGIQNIGIGYAPLNAATTTYNNIAIGIQSLNLLQTHTNGIRNVAIGDLSLSNMTSGSSNVSIGFQSTSVLISGSSNTSIGYQSADGINYISGGTFLGSESGPTISGLVNATAIGANAKVGSSNSLVLGNNASVGIGTTTPNANLDIFYGNTFTSPKNLLRVSQYDSNREVFKIYDFGGSGGSQITSEYATWGFGMPADVPTANRLSIKGNTSNSSTASIIVQDNLSNYIFILRDDGKVGIGTVSPSETLDVSGKTKTINFQMTSGATTTGYVLTDSDGNGNAQWQPASGITGVGNVFKYTTTTAFTASVTQTITHNLNTKFVHCSVWDSSDHLVTAQVVRTSGNQTNAVDITISTSGTYDILITG